MNSPTRRRGRIASAVRQSHFRSGLRVANQGVTDAASSLPDHAGEIRHADVDFRGRELAQEFRDAGDLRAPRGVLANALRGFDELGE